MFTILFFGCFDPGAKVLPEQTLLSDVPSAEENRSQEIIDDNDAVYQKAEGVLVDILFLGGKPFLEVNDLLSSQLGPLQEHLELNNNEHFRRYEQGDISVKDGAVFRIRFFYPESLRRNEALAQIGFPQQVGNYIITHKEYQLTNQFGFRRLRMKRESRDTELVTEIEAWKWIPQEQLRK